MEITPEVLNGQGFREVRRGYDPNEVNDFLERTAVAVGRLREQLERATGAARAAEARAETLAEQLEEARATAPTSDTASELEESLRRTLVLAQKTADAAIREAEETAARTLAQAQEQAEFTVREAKEAADRARSEAETQARRQGEETRRRVLDEIASLEQTREAMNADVRALRRYLDDQRARLRTAARDLQRLVDDPTALKEFEPPTISSASLADAGPGAEPADTAEPDPELWDLADDEDAGLTGDEPLLGEAGELDPEAIDDEDGPSLGELLDAPGGGWGEELTDAEDDADYFEDLRRAISGDPSRQDGEEGDDDPERGPREP